MNAETERVDEIDALFKSRWQLLAVMTLFVVSLAASALFWVMSMTELAEGHRMVGALLLVAGLLVCVELGGLLWALLRTRRVAQRALQQMRASMREQDDVWGLAMTGLDGAVTDWNLVSGVTYYSPRWAELLGLSVDEVGQTADEWMSRVHPKDKDRLMEIMAELFAGPGNSADHEFRFLHKDGSAIWVHGHADIVSRDAAGKPLRLIGTNIDITERKQAELTRDALLSVHEDTGIGLFGVKGKRFTYLNPAFARITGYSIEELMALSDVHQVVHPEEQAHVADLHQQRQANEWQRARYEVAIQTKTGERRQVEVVTSYLANNERFDVMGLMMDITQRKQAEFLRDALLEAHVEAGVGLIAVADARVVFANPAYCQITGYSLDELKAMPNVIAGLVHPDEMPHMRERWARRQAGEQLSPRYDTLIITKSGEVRDVELAVTTTRKNGEFQTLGIMLDITERKRLSRQLQESHDTLLKFSRQLPGVIFQFRLYPDGRYCFPFVSESLKDRYGVTAAQLMADPDAIKKFQHIEDRARDTQAFLKSRSDLVPWRSEYRAQTLNGERWISSEANPERLEDGSLLWYGFSFDITERKRGEADLQLAALVYEVSSEAMSVAGADGRIITINPAFTRITGYAPDEIIGGDARQLGIDPPQYRVILQALNSSGHWQGEVQQQRKDGDTYPAALSINTIFDSDGKPVRYVSLFSDITTRKQTEVLIWRQANYDALTQLPNRSMFHERVAQEIKKAQRTQTHLALLFIDLDHFKEVNDTLGHDIGDLLLLEAAHRIAACVRETDAVARLGGDEFTVLLCDIDAEDHAIIERIAQAIIDSLVDPFFLGENEAYVSASIGITLFPNDAGDIDGLFRNADQAMYLSKSQGRNCYRYFTAELQQRAQHRLRLITDLRGALAGDQFKVYFQPIVELASGRIVKAEALIRWQHPQRGLVMPGDFIALAEEAGLIDDIGDWVFRESLRWVKHWQTQFDPNFQISVNKSPLQFNKEGNGHSPWLDYLDEMGVSPRSIAIEITEGVLLNASAVVSESLLNFRDAGVQVALDDFGTGYSSLAYLNKFDIDYLKIDQSFVRDLASGGNELALCEAMVIMAHRLGLKVIAEGVETTAQCDLLQSIACDYVQGYLFSRPLPADEFEALLSGHRTM
jgi:diguanylate cyclase (GGDEF)-like protein/PAS domain S-box-containing protein